MCCCTILTALNTALPEQQNATSTTSLPAKIQLLLNWTYHIVALHLSSCVIFAAAFAASDKEGQCRYTLLTQLQIEQAIY